MDVRINSAGDVLAFGHDGETDDTVEFPGNEPPDLRRPYPNASSSTSRYTVEGDAPYRRLMRDDTQVAVEVRPPAIPPFDVEQGDTPAGGVQSIVAGDNIDVDDTDAAHPVVSAVPSGASGSTERNIYYANNQTFAANGDLSWTADDGPNMTTGLLDLTDPTQPVVVAAGVYTFSIWLESENGQAGEFMWCEFDADLNGDDPIVFISGPMGPAGTALASISTALTFYMPAGAVLDMFIKHSASANRTFKGRMNVQRLS